MAPTMGLNNNNGNGQNGDSPLSKTYQYRKIMKPMLERKRRARINRCLDELKELITGALQNVSCTKCRRDLMPPNGTSLIAYYLIACFNVQLISSLICSVIINYLFVKEMPLHSCAERSLFSRLKFSHNSSSRSRGGFACFSPSPFFSSMRSLHLFMIFMFLNYRATARKISQSWKRPTFWS